MSNLVQWLEASIGNKKSDRFLRLLADCAEICQLFAVDGRLYISYKRRSVIKQFPDIKMSHMEQGFKNSGFWCPDGKIDNYGWMTWTKIKPIPQPNPTPTIALVHVPKPPVYITPATISNTQIKSGTNTRVSVQSQVRVRTHKFTFAPEWLNTHEWNRVFLPREPRPPNIDGSWINDL